MSDCEKNSDCSGNEYCPDKDTCSKIDAKYNRADQEEGWSCEGVPRYGPPTRTCQLKCVNDESDLPGSGLRMCKSGYKCENEKCVEDHSALSDIIMYIVLVIIIVIFAVIFLALLFPRKKIVLVRKPGTSGSAVDHWVSPQ